jgi:hypothetical protein
MYRGTIMALLTPLLSEADLAGSSEGALDPLGLFSIADSLAVRLVPGVRERMSRPRFLTAAAASLAVSSQFDPERVAADGVSEPWQVFEWYLVEGLVRTADEDTDLGRLPGQDKARRALRDGVPLSAKRYLKAPSVFGFHGVYRLLAQSLDIDVAGHLGEVGMDLLDAWTREQGLKGFHGTLEGAGANFRQKLVGAVEEGLVAGAVARQGGWEGWQFFRRHLRPGEIGRNEASVISRALLDAGAGFRRMVFESLVSANGQAVWTEAGSERAFHTWLRERASGDLKGLLEAILTYETWARLLQDAFDDCLLIMTKKQSKTAPGDLAKAPGVTKAWKRVPDLFAELVEKLDPYHEAARFQLSFAALADKLVALDWVQQLLGHHRFVQSRKPPNGKNPWFERFDDGSVIIRPDYLRDKGGRGDDSYVHGYRTGPLWSFALDLGEVH